MGLRATRSVWCVAHTPALGSLLESSPEWTVSPAYVFPCVRRSSRPRPEGSNMSEQLLDWFLLHAKDPVPCDICRTPTANEQLTECWVPAYVSEELGFVVRRAMWVCETCPLP